MTFTSPKSLVASTAAQLLSVFALVVLFCAASPAQVHAQTGGAVPPNARFQALTLGEWGAEYYRSLFGNPVDALPLPCGFGYRGRALLLATSFGQPLELECTVAPGTPIAFPILSIAGLCTGTPADCETLTIESLRAELAAYIDEVVPERDLRVEVNGVAVHPLQGFRGAGDFTGVLAAGSVVGNEVTEPIVVAAQDGYWMVLSPLPAGRHTLRIFGRHQSSGFEAVTNVQLTVAR